MKTPWFKVNPPPPQKKKKKKKNITFDAPTTLVFGNVTRTLNRTKEIPLLFDLGTIVQISIEQASTHLLFKFPLLGHLLPAAVVTDDIEVLSWCVSPFCSPYLTQLNARVLFCPRFCPSHLLMPDLQECVWPAVINPWHVFLVDSADALWFVVLDSLVVFIDSLAFLSWRSRMADKCIQHPYVDR